MSNIEMNKNISKVDIITSLNNQAVVNNPTVSKVIHDVRGENLDDVKEHVESAIKNAILEAAEDDIEVDLDDFDLDLDDIDDEDLDKQFGDDSNTSDDTDVDDDEDDDTVQIVTFNSNNYLTIVQKAYEMAKEDGIHRDKINHLSFLRATTGSNFMALFAYMDIPNTNLKYTFSRFSADTAVRLDGVFYGSTFNNDSILNWPFNRSNIISYTQMFGKCPYHNLTFNKKTGLHIIADNSISQETQSGLDDIGRVLKSKKK